RVTIIVSSAGDYSMAPWLCLRPLPRQQRPQRDDVALVAHADRGRRGARGPALGFGSGDRAGREEAVSHGLDEGPAAAAADELALARRHGVRPPLGLRSPSPPPSPSGPRRAGWSRPRTPDRLPGGRTAAARPRASGPATWRSGPPGPRRPWGCRPRGPRAPRRGRARAERWR